MSRFLYEARCKITTRLIALDNGLPGRLHPLWEITPLDLYDIQQGGDAVRHEAETLEHMVVRCPAYQHIRADYFPFIKRSLQECYGSEAMEEYRATETNTMKAIPDPNPTTQCSRSPQTDPRLHLEYLTENTSPFIHTNRVVTIGRYIYSVVFVFS